MIVFHYHLRPGGVRRVIEMTVPAIAARMRPAEIVLAAGEAPDPQWLAGLKRKLDAAPLRTFIEPAFGYLSEQTDPTSQILGRIDRGLDELLKMDRPENTLVWAHNPGVGRNLLFVRALYEHCERKKIRVIAHEHDWWFDNRWHRWPEIKNRGLRTFQDAARALFPCHQKLTHAVINHADGRQIARQFRGRVSWLPNPSVAFPEVSMSRLKRARKWLRDQIGDSDAPLWIVPARFVRRKNIAEALLLTRWLRPEAWLITTAGISSEHERPHAEALQAAANANNWPLRLSVLHKAGVHAPGIDETIAASEAILLTSVQEGFGLPFLEASAASRPLIAREIPNISPDLARLGFKFPQFYKEILLPCELYDWASERARQKRLYNVWLASLPRSIRHWAGKPPIIRGSGKPRPIPFSRLTMTAQLEVLGRPVDESWSVCSELNPFLKVWRRRAANESLQVTPWPKTADKRLGCEAYAEHFAKAALAPLPPLPRSGAGISVQNAFIKWKLSVENQFPLLWADET